MLQLFNQIQSGLTGSGGSGGDSLLQASNYSDDYMDLEAQKKIAENIRFQSNSLFFCGIMQSFSFHEFNIFDEGFKTFSKTWNRHWSTCPRRLAML